MSFEQDSLRERFERRLQALIAGGAEELLEAASTLGDVTFANSGNRDSLDIETLSLAENTEIFAECRGNNKNKQLLGVIAQQ